MRTQHVTRFYELGEQWMICEKCAKICDETFIGDYMDFTRTEENVQMIKNELDQLSERRCSKSFLSITS